MCKHKEKNCPRCKLSFECKAGSIMQCQCNAVQLSVEERMYVELKYEDGICASCLTDLQKEYTSFKED